MSDTGPIGEIAAAYTEALLHVAPLDVGERELSANTDAPRFVIIPLGGPLPGKQQAHGRGVVQVLDLNVEVHCWAAGDDELASHEAAWRLWQALVTITPDLTKGRNYVLGAMTIGRPKWLDRGVSYVQAIMFRVPVQRAEIPTSGQEQAVTDASLGIVVPTDDGPDPTGTVSPPGDGVIEGSES